MATRFGSISESISGNIYIFFFFFRQTGTYNCYFFSLNQHSHCTSAVIKAVLVSYSRSEMAKILGLSLRSGSPAGSGKDSLIIPTHSVYHTFIPASLAQKQASALLFSPALALVSCWQGRSLQARESVRRISGDCEDTARGFSAGLWSEDKKNVIII